MTAKGPSQKPCRHLIEDGGWLAPRDPQLLMNYIWHDQIKAFGRTQKQTAAFMLRFQNALNTGNLIRVRFAG